MKSSHVRIAVIACLVSVLLLVVLASPIFSIKKVEITEMEKYSYDDIINKTGLKANMNLFMINTGLMKKKLLSDPYIESVKFERNFPDKLNISIVERKVTGYVPYMGAYLYIDGYGRVLESNTNLSKKIPIFVGLSFSSFVVGDILSVPESEKFDAVVKMSNLMKKYDFDDDIRVDVSDFDDIHAYVNSIDVVLGDIRDCDDKIKVMYAALEQLPKEYRGTLYLNEGKGVYRFRHLT